MNLTTNSPDNIINPEDFNQFHEPPKPNQHVLYVNASGLKDCGNCDRKLFLRMVKGYTKENKLQNFKAGYGVAFHKGLEVIYNMEPELRTVTAYEDVLAKKVLPAFRPYEPYIPQDRIQGWRNANHLTQAFFRYGDQYSRGTDVLVPLNIPLKNAQKNLLEQKFCIPYYEDSQLVVYMVGTIDMPATYCDRVVINDHKTTSLKPMDFFELFRLNVQSMFYVHWFKVLSGMDEYVPFLVNGIFIKSNPVKDEEKGLFNGVTFERRQFEYTKEQMLEYKEWLDTKMGFLINRVKRCLEFSFYPPMNPTACDGKWSMCQFYNVCSRPGSLTPEVLGSVYRQTPYNPLMQVEEEV